jgi:cytidylate kinase
MTALGPVIAIDGYSSCGKSTVAKALSRILHIRYIDSGAMYRAVTLYFLQHNIPFYKAGTSPDMDYTAILDRIIIRFDRDRVTGAERVLMNGTDVTEQIRTMAVSEQVSHVSAIREVRRRMVCLQQQMETEGGLVMDGRDIGTTVFPDADLKIFMTADPEVRVRRRYDELHRQGKKVTIDEVRENINSRDFEDTHRLESPLRKADDAVILDNTHLSPEQQVQFVLELVYRKTGIRQPEKS